MAQPSAQPTPPTDAPEITKDQAILRLKNLEYQARRLRAEAGQAKADQRRIARETAQLHDEIKRLMAVLEIEYVPPPSARK